ncbi:PIR protein [Plasmodium vivax]|uniref:VIR protein n=1 Tax=Plasmodium vivax TaxID=5855 RepID=A0A565A3T9_PLAVI|nr:PIR protein [Plasmodium vivax]
MLPFIQSFVFSFSDELYSQRFYNNLDGSSDYQAYILKCISLNAFPQYNSTKRICAKLLQYLDTNTISRNTNNKYDACKLLNFWVYRWFFDILRTKGEESIPLAYGKLLLIWNDFIKDKPDKPGNKICRPISELAAYGDWRYRKELYEYYVDYEDFSKTLASWPTRCKDFYHYVESKRKLYEHFKKPCSSDGKKGCPEFYSECKKYDPDEVLPHPDCKGVIMQKTATAASRLPLKINGHPFKESESDEESDDMKAFGAPKLNENSNNVRTYGNVLLGVVATSMTSGALYRFTPLGGMIRNGLGWNNNNMRNFNGGDIRLYDYASESFNPYPGEEHYIGYHPA